MTTASRESDKPTFDFRHTFPHKTWLSAWTNSPGSQEIYRCRVTSTRHEDRQEIEIAVSIEHRDGTHQCLGHYTLGLQAFDRAAAIIIDSLARAHGLRFQEHDFSKCRNIAEYELQILELGWSSRLQ